MTNEKTITGYFVDPENCIAEPRTIDKSLEGYYALLRCDLIDMPERRIGGEYFTIICDDEGLLKEGNMVSAYDPMGNPALVGPIFVVKFDGGEDVRSLTEEELDLVGEHVMQGITATPDGMPCLTAFLIGLEY